MNTPNGSSCFFSSQECRTLEEILRSQNLAKPKVVDFLLGDPRVGETGGTNIAGQESCGQEKDVSNSHRVCGFVCVLRGVGDVDCR